MGVDPGSLAFRRLTPTRLNQPETRRRLAEREGFEPSVGCPTHAFQACAFDHSPFTTGHSNPASSASPIWNLPFRSTPRRTTKRSRLRRVPGQSESCPAPPSDLFCAGLPEAAHPRYRNRLDNLTHSRARNRMSPHHPELTVICNELRLDPSASLSPAACFKWVGVRSLMFPLLIGSK
jgi:hypothetical protein